LKNSPNDKYDVFKAALPNVLTGKWVDGKDQVDTAIKVANGAALKFLIQKGARKFDKWPRVRSTDKKIDSILWTQTLIDYIKGSKNSNLEALLKEKNQNINAWNATGTTIMHTAAKANNIQAIKMIAAQKSFNINTVDSNGKTVLQSNISEQARNTIQLESVFEGVRRGDVKLLEKAIKDKVDVKALDWRGHTMLYEAVSHFNPSIVSTLMIAGADPNQKSRGSLLPSAAINAVKLKEYEKQKVGIMKDNVNSIFREL